MHPFIATIQVELLANPESKKRKQPSLASHTKKNISRKMLGQGAIQKRHATKRVTKKGLHRKSARAVAPSCAGKETRSQHPQLPSSKAKCAQSQKRKRLEDGLPDAGSRLMATFADMERRLLQGVS